MGQGIKGRCRTLAGVLGCKISEYKGNIVQGKYGPSRFDVRAPMETYGKVGAPRIESNIYLRMCQSWQEVWEFLQAVRIDLLFHKCGAGVPETKAILQMCEEEGEILFCEWTGKEDTPTGLILCDWLGEQGRDDLADLLRKGLLTLPQKVLREFDMVDDQGKSLGKVTFGDFQTEF